MSSLTFRGKPLSASRVLRSVQARVFKPRAVDTYHGVFASFEEAARNAPKETPFGYDSAQSETWYQNKHDEVHLDDYPVLYWLREAFRDCESVFEIGGHVGVAYYGFAKVLDYPANLSWTICDVPSVAAAGTALAKQRGRTNLHFVTHPNQSEGAEIVLAAGALQYIDSPSLAETIASFRIKPRHVLLNTTPVYDGPSFVTLQYIGTAYCPYRIFNRAELVQSLKDVGYSLVTSWQKDRALRVPRHPDRSFDHYSGFYFRAD